MVEYMWKVLAKIEAHKLALTRIQLHAINFHMLCYDRKIWRAGRDSIAASIAVSLQIAGGYSKANFSSIVDDLPKLRFNLPERLKIKTKLGKIVKTKEQLAAEPMFSFFYGTRFLPDSRWKCVIGQTIEVKKPVRLRGLGDNISAAGLVYQRLVKFYPDIPEDSTIDQSADETDL